MLSVSKVRLASYRHRVSSFGEKRRVRPGRCCIIPLIHALAVSRGHVPTFDWPERTTLPST